MSEREWQPIETLAAVDLETRMRGVILTAFDPNDPYEDGTIGPHYVRLGNGPHHYASEPDVDRWLDFDTSNYGIWRPPPTHWMLVPAMPLPTPKPIPQVER